MPPAQPRRPAAAAAGTAVALLVCASAATAPAQAQPTRPYGTVVSTDGIYQRQFPSTDSSSRGLLPYREQAGLRCKVRAQDIDGNTVWYLLRDRPTWVAARYVANTGTVPYCKDVT